MKFSDICSVEDCTGCAACASICPKHCISLREGYMGSLYPVIDESICIDCGLCKKTCPNRNKIAFHTTRKVFVGWSKDIRRRHDSASGGIISTIYDYAILNNIQTFGVVWDREIGCRFIEVKTDKDIANCQNSKYVYANIDGVYNNIKHSLKIGREVIFIGLPCQVAALKSFLNKDYDNLYCVDIICHGVAPFTYLDQHISSLEKKKHRICNKLFFRNPRYNTYTFTFTLEDKKGIFYKKRVLGTDNYQLGYHRALIYRENCYSCKYARAERVGDLTVGDFTGLGKVIPFRNDYHNVSCILSNSDKGENLLDRLHEYIHIEERPAEEAFSYERQLKAPSTKHPNRITFENIYQYTGNFEEAADNALKQEKVKAIFTKYKLVAITYIRKMTPDFLVSYLRHYVGRK